MGYYVPPYRYFTADFVQDVLAGRKKLFRKTDIVYLGVLFNYPDCSKTSLINQYPNLRQPHKYVPDADRIAQVDKRYILNVNL